MKQHLILLHGALGSKADFDILKTLLVEQFEVHAFSFIGHGGRENREVITLDVLTQDLQNLITKNKINNPIIFGHSMGGYVALNLASKKSINIKKILTYGTKFIWNQEVLDKELRMLNPIKMEEKVPQFVKYLGKIHAPLDWNQVILNTRNLMSDLVHNGLTYEELSSIDTDVTIGIGSLDKMVTSEESKNATSKFLNAKMIILENQPHEIKKVDPEKLRKFIAEFNP